MSNLIGKTDNGGAGEDIAMTLAAIAYETGYDAITNLLKQYAPDWKCVWWPDKELNGNYAYIAYNGAQYIVAIRGSVLSFSWEAFQDWFEQDFNVLEQVDWTYPSSSTKPKISLGASYGLADLTSMVMTNPAGQTTMLDFLLPKAVDQFVSFGVVGHSLGGGLSTVFAPWLYYQLQQANKPIPYLFPVMTFAAPSIGNLAFVNAYDTTFDASWRFYNILDIVPMASATVKNMGNMFPPPAPAASQIKVTYDGFTVTLKDGIWALAKILEAAEWWQSSHYTQTNINNGSVQFNLKKHVCPVDTKDPLVVQWFDQASCQHSRCTYLTYAGAKPFNCD